MAVLEVEHQVQAMLDRVVQEQIAPRRRVHHYVGALVAAEEFDAVLIQLPLESQARMHVRRSFSNVYLYLYIMWESLLYL